MRLFPGISWCFLIFAFAPAYAQTVSEDTLVLIDMGGYQSGSAAGWNAYDQLIINQVNPVADRNNLVTGVTVTALDDSFYTFTEEPVGRDWIYDGIHVPKEARNDYFYKNSDVVGSSARLRFNGLPAGTYHVTLFAGRADDAGQYGKIWTGTVEPGSQNTGNFAAGSSTVTVTVPADGILYYRHLEDGTGGISGMILRRDMGGGAEGSLFLLDFGANGTTTQGAAEGWDTIGYARANDVFRLTDLSGRNRGITFTVLETGFESYNTAPPNATAVYDGVEIPLRARNDYLYRITDTPNTTVRTRIDGLQAGSYRVTVFAGRTSDASQYAKIWSGGSEPASQNTGNFAKASASVDVSVLGGAPLFFTHLEDGTGGISGMIIRHLPSPASVAKPYGNADFHRYGESGVLELIWNSKTGKTYSLEGSPDLVNWTTIASGMFSPADGRSVRRFAPLRGRSSGFFRIREN